MLLYHKTKVHYFRFWSHRNIIVLKSDHVAIEYPLLKHIYYLNACIPATYSIYGISHENPFAGTR